MDSPKAYRFITPISAVFVTVLLVSNVASSAKIVDLGLSLWSLPLAFDAGTIVFPISYVFGDILTEVYGYRSSRGVIWTGFLCLVLASLTFWIVRLLPGEATWQRYAGDEAYNAILGSMSSGGIIIASLTAYLCGEFSNSFVLAKLKIRTRGRLLWSRTIGSTLIGQLVDTGAFVLVATLFGVFPWSLFTTLIAANYILKVLVEAVMTPVTYGVVNFLKRAEHEDYYDQHTNFNPFST